MRIEQDQQYEGEDWWKWSVWIEGSAPELAEVEKVIWRLHPTFSDPVRERTDPADGFRLSTAGWGTFRVTADVQMRNGTINKLQHDLELHYPRDGRPARRYTTYTVRAGDTLTTIAKQHLGDANAYLKIFELNKDQLSDPKNVSQGQVLKIPVKE